MISSKFRGSLRVFVNFAEFADLPDFCGSTTAQKISEALLIAGYKSCTFLLPLLLQLHYIGPNSESRGELAGADSLGCELTDTAFVPVIISALSYKRRPKLSNTVFSS